MCGIAGFVLESPGPPGAALQAAAAGMASRLHHRGPDSGGTWVSEDEGVALGHRRLAILDLTPDGAQPMCSETGRYCVTFNGEIYNHGPLRDELVGRGHRFRGRSDTEVLLAAAEEWGITGALERFNGMFAFGLWDREERRLHLARDRMGEKPLYYGWYERAFVFGSELKAVRAYPGFRDDVDRDALALYMRHNYVPTPYTIYRRLRKLVPGGLLTVSAGAPGVERLTRYWSPWEVVARAAEHPFAGTPEEAVDELDALLLDAVRLRMHADVPLGTFLSGGVDSTTVTALMQAQSARPVKTFTIGFEDARFNEAAYARRVAEHLGTEHTELYVRPRDIMEVIPRLPELYDEPFSDPSQIPTYLVSKLAREHVTVSLSGDGGDELFCGYDRYLLGIEIWRKLRWLPLALRVVGSLAGRTASALYGALSRAVGVGRDWHHRFDSRARLLETRTPEAMYYQLMSQWAEPSRLVVGSAEPATLFTDGRIGALRFGSLPGMMMFLDALTYLPDCILVKLDRASMGVSLESRVPLLDHRVVELAWRLPLEAKLRGTETKWALRQVLYRRVPRTLVERAKQGFSIPTGAWLRGPLRSWAGDLLAEETLRRQGYLDARLVQRAFAEHVSGRANHWQSLWDVLMFEAWLKHASTAP